MINVWIEGEIKMMLVKNLVLCCFLYSGQWLKNEIRNKNVLLEDEMSYYD